MPAPLRRIVKDLLKSIKLLRFSHMRKRTFWLAAILSGVILGCGPSSTVREIRDLRASGKLPEARGSVLAALQENPSHMDLWLEFAHIDVDLTRQADREDNPLSLNYLAESTLLCGGYAKYRNQKLSKEWLDVARQATGEAIKQGNIVLTAFRAQAQSADYLTQLLEMRRGEPGLDGARMSAEQMVESYRSSARDLLFQSVLILRFMELLPEISSGTAAVLVAQVQNARDEWRQKLELRSDLVDTITERANRRVDVALSRVMDDFQTLGYVAPGTIIENGIVEQ